MWLFFRGSLRRCTPMSTVRQNRISSCLSERNKGLRPEGSPGTLKVLFPLQDRSLLPLQVPHGSAVGGCCCMGAQPGPTAGFTHRTPFAHAATALARGLEGPELQAGWRKINALNRLVRGSAQNLMFDTYLGGWDWWWEERTPGSATKCPIPTCLEGAGRRALPGQWGTSSPPPSCSQGGNCHPPACPKLLWARQAHRGSLPHGTRAGSACPASGLLIFLRVYLPK